MPAVKETVKAGITIPYDKTKTVFEGIADADKEAFVYRLQYNEASYSYSYGWAAFASADLVMTITDANGKEVTTGIYKGGQEYKITAELAQTYSPYSGNYIFESGSAVFTPVHGNAAVTATAPATDEIVVVSDKITDNTHVITPEEGISYFSDMLGDEYKKGHYLTIQITAPREYDGIPLTAVYEESLKAAGACMIDADNEAIKAVFDAASYDKKSFAICWDEDYEENFVVDFSKAVLLDNLTEAQAPKSLSFISPVKKMYIGDYQQLDVKLVKLLESDIISLKYASSNPDVLCVNEEGYITALSAGTAVVTVSSVRKVNGKMMDTDPIKKASVTITVSKVTAPKVTKVQAWDTYANASFAKTNNGFRKEVYVLKGKQSVSDFETAIASMKNQKWEGIFVIAPYYTYKTSTSAYLKDLNPNTEYTVYVRNVSRFGKYCECENACQIVKSVAGSVKSFKTSKHQVRELELKFEDGKAIYNWPSYEVKLSDKKTMVSVYGLFTDLTESTDKGKYFAKKLPLNKNEQKTYVNPKLKYYVGTYSASKTKDTIMSINDGYMNKTSIASINSNGRLTLKGVGSVYVVAYDALSGVKGYTIVNITADADNIKGKTRTLKLGQSVKLSDLLTYKEGSKVLTGDYDTCVIIDEAVTKAFEESEYFELQGTSVVAVKSKGSLQVPLSDAYVGADKFAVVTLKSAALEQVKGLKTTLITDQFAQIEFTHTGYAKGFRICITDGRGDKMKDIQINDEELYNPSTGKYEYRITGLTQKSKYTVSVSALYGDESVKEESKAVKKTFSTSVTPASYDALETDQYGGVAIQIFHKNKSAYIEDAVITTGNVYTLNLTNNKYNLNLGAKYSQTDTLTWTSNDKKVATVKANKDTFTATFKPVKSGTTIIEVKSKLTKAVIARYKINVHAVGNADNFYGNNEPLPKDDVPDVDYDKPDYNDSDILTINNLKFKRVSRNVTNSVSVNQGEYKWYAFTALSSGTYRFHASEGKDSDIWIFKDVDKVSEVYKNVTASQLKSKCHEYNDYRKESAKYNFDISYSMEEGQTIYFAVGSYSLNSSIDFTFTVTKE